MYIREVLIDSPLPPRSSGAWVARETSVCGYVVTFARSGLSYFIVSIELSFWEIEACLGNRSAAFLRQN